MVNKLNFSKDDILKAAREVCDLYATDLYTVEECLKACGVKSTGTWAKWRHRYPEIEEMYQAAKEEKRRVYYENITERALTSLEKLVSGFEHKVIEREGEQTEDPATGEKIIRTKKIKEKTIYVPPNPTTIFFVLQNRLPDKWKRNPEALKPQKTSKFADWTEEEIINEIKRLEGITGNTESDNSAP